MPRALGLSAVLLGFTSLLIQIVAARELLTSFLGNEISIALILLVWLGMVAIGSATAGRLLGTAQRASAAVPWLHLATAAALLPSVWIAQAAGGAGRFPGEVIGPGTMVLLAAASLGPPCVLLGGLFAALCRTVETESGEDRIAIVYALEAGGAVLAGILFHFLIAERLGSSQTAVLAAAANAAGAASVWRHRGATYSAGAAALAALAVVGVAIVNPDGGFRLDTVGLARRWSGVNVVEETNSRYGNIAVIHEAGQLTFYEAGLPAFTTEDTQKNEVAVHVPLLSHPNPRRVLMISGGLGGGLDEVLKHPVERVDYVEMDRALIQLARRLLPAELRQALDDPRTRLYPVDGRAYVKSTAREYDVVLILAPDPATTALSRFYTREFFREVRRILAPSGVMCVGLTAAQAKLSGPRLYVHATVHRALTDVFPVVEAIPGERTQYLAAESREAFAIEPDVLAERLRERDLRTAFVNETWFDYALGPLPRDMLAGSLRGAGDIPANRDARPIAAHYWLRTWLTQLSPRSAELMASAESVATALWLLIPVGLLVSLALRRSERLLTLGTSVCVWGTGFLEMGAQLTLVMAYQAVAGYLYHRIGLLMSLFMLGLAVGAAVGRRIAARYPQATGSALMAVVVCQAASALCLPLLFAASGAGLSVIDTVFALAAAWMGFLGGLNFPLAVALIAARTGGAARAASRLYALDLTGAAMGAVLIGAITVPALGIGRSCQAIAAVELAALGPLAMTVLWRRARA